MSTLTVPRSTRGVLARLAGLGVVLALVAAGLGSASTEAAESLAADRNMAINATTSASFIASHNNLNAVNNGVHSNSGAPETSYWGTWAAAGRPASQYLQYDWADPVTVSRSVVSFWTDAAAGTGANVTVPQSWTVDYWDPSTAAWLPVPNPSSYGTGRTGTNETTFDPVTTSRVRATFQAYPNAAGTSYSALGVSEWEVWGGIAEADPTAVIEVPEVHTRTTPGTAPALPESLDVVRVGGAVTPVAVTWTTVPPGTLVAGAQVEAAGDLDGLARDALATVWVRETPSATITAVDDASVITTAGVRPTLPRTAVATYDDGSRDSAVPVSWAPLNRADYQVEGFFEVAGDVAGTDHDPTAWVFVEPADGSVPTPGFELATAPAQPGGAGGWFTSDVTVEVRPVDSAPASYEAKVDDGGWVAVVDERVAVSGDGTHEVAVRESGAEDSEALTVRIDGTAPTSTTSVAGRTVTVSAADATSGVDHVEVRTDGRWTTYTAPVTVGDEAVTLRHRAVDAAGNVGAGGSVDLPAVERPAPRATVMPAISGPAMVGRTLVASTGTWDVEGVGLAVQWLADGAPLAGATGTSYAVRPGDVGKRVSVRVTATKAQHQAGSATSVVSGVVQKAATTTRVTAARKNVVPGSKVRLTVRVSATGVTPSGVVRIYDRGRLVKTVQLRAGKAALRSKISGPGRHRLVAKYVGTAWAAASNASTRVTAR